MISRPFAAGVRALLATGIACSAHAGVFIDAIENSPGRITHPSGYSGSGGTLTVDVCVDSTSANATDMVLPVQNVITTFNNLEVHINNLVYGLGNVPVGFVDFESVLLHEVGHCLGLWHSNLASESNQAAADQDYTKSGDGNPSIYNLAPGSDGLIATGDDSRGNDVNYYWYEDGENDPYRINASVVDSTTYSVTLGNLPAGDSFAASGHRGNASSFNAPFSEAVMNQGSVFGEEQRLLTADDVSALRYAMSGEDEIAGNSDDYLLVLNYAGSSPNPNCDINVDFDNAQTTFAGALVSRTNIGSGHYAVTSANVFMNTGWNWFFNDETCGNGAFEGSEVCDDGNVDTGDGCNQTCTVEIGYSCAPGFPSVCGPICGNNDVQPPSEACDDGGTTPGDGCDASCEIEPGWICSGDPSSCNEICGNGITTPSETCDDGGTLPGDGCDGSCQIESGWSCSGDPSICGEVCGNGITTSSEGCDDGGTSPGDGCSATCQIESGWMCGGAPSSCGGICGDGVILGAEGCDDGGTSPGDGCGASCQVESGWMCIGAPSICDEVCGDGLIAGAETCDDDGMSSGDGCDATCQEEPGWVCSGEPSSCGEVCGDGVITVSEGCDDAGTSPGDGCDDSCQEELGWMCSGEPSSCEFVTIDTLGFPARALLALALLGTGAAWLVTPGRFGRHPA